MLIDINTVSDPILQMIARVNGNTEDTKRIQTGIYEIDHFNFNMCLNEHKIKNEYPEFDNGFDCYGVCDNYKQILEQCSEITTSNRAFVISVTPVEQDKQPEDGGWRWHKWGQYIGMQVPQCQYIYDEPIIEKVYCYHIYELETNHG